jgi:hypothetical protein
MKNRYFMIAKKIAAYEQSIQLGKNVKDNQHKIEKIMCTLSGDDLFKVMGYLEEYFQEY